VKDLFIISFLIFELNIHNFILCR